MTEIPIRREVNQQVLEGLDAAYAANRAFDAIANARQVRDTRATILRSPSVELKALFGLTGNDSDLLAEAEEQIQLHEKEFTKKYSEAGTKIGRGTLGGLLFTISTPTNVNGRIVPTTEYESEYREGVLYAYAANKARIYGWDISLVKKYDNEAGKRLGKTTDIDIWEDFRRNVPQPILPEDGESTDEAFDNALITRASRCLKENDTETLRIAQLQEHVNTIQRAVTELNHDITGWEGQTDLSRLQENEGSQEQDLNDVFVERIPTDEEIRALNWFNENILNSE